MTERTQSKSLGVRIVRLQSGEEIICQHSIEDGVHTLEKPAVIIPTSIVPLLVGITSSDYSHQ